MESDLPIDTDVKRILWWWRFKLWRLFYW